jgi:CO/xanthine dehydrogenase FAD-binding subunit
MPVSLRSVKEYFAPDSKEEVLKLLARYGEGALIVAGGSFVRGLDARNVLSGIEAMIDLQNLGLKQITAGSTGMSIGAMVTFTELQQREEVKNSAVLGAVRDALDYPPLQIRNVATVGGNIAAACPYFDLPTALMTLDAVVQALGPGGARNIALQEFFTSLFQSTLAADEFVTGLTLPPLPARSSSAFMKCESNANDLAIVNVAVRVTLDASGHCQESRVVIGGGVAETPCSRGQKCCRARNCRTN